MANYENLIILDGAIGRELQAMGVPMHPASWCGPATGQAVSDLVLHGESSIDISGLGLGRFADVGPDWRQERGWVPAPCR